MDRISSQIEEAAESTQEPRFTRPMKAASSPPSQGQASPGIKALTIVLRWTRIFLGIWSFLTHPLLHESVAPMRDLIMMLLGLG